jgi:ABC-type multidrug transport system fused ATPase/permease subunit
VLTTVRRGLALVDSWTRRRVIVSVGLATGLAVLEMAAFGLLYLLVKAVSGDGIAHGPSKMLAAAGVSDAESQQVALGVLVVVVMLVKSAAAVAVTRWQARVQNLSEARLASRLFRDYLGQDFQFHVDRNSSVLIRNLTGSIGIVATSVVGSVAALLTDGLVLLGTLAVLAVVAPWLAIGLAIFALAVLAGYVLVIGPIIQRAATVDQHLTAGTIQALQEAFSGIKSVHAFNVMSAVADSFDEKRGRLARSRAMLTFTQRLPQYYLEVCLVIGAASATVILAQNVGRTTAFALLGLLVVAALRILPSVARILGSLNAIRTGSTAVELLREEARRIPDAGRPLPEAGAPPPPGDGSQPRIVFDGVCFRYPNRSDDVLSNVSFSVALGEFVGVVGPSGAGKTTLVDLLLGLLQPTAGAVRVDGQRLDVAVAPAWRGRVGYVPQETYLLDGSILENVRFHRALPVDEDPEALVWQALEHAQLAATVRAIPEGLAAQVGERGVRLSGGQRQRLGIARALLLRPAVLVLDEATSALDGATEAAVNATITALRGTMTVVMIAHRLSTVRDCDKLVLLEGGHVAAVGGLADLARRSAAFAGALQAADVRLGTT